jgi:hypothetical protein
MAYDAIGGGRRRLRYRHTPATMSMNRPTAPPAIPAINAVLGPAVPSPGELPPLAGEVDDGLPTKRLTKTKKKKGSGRAENMVPWQLGA